MARVVSMMIVLYSDQTGLSLVGQAYQADGITPTGGPLTGFHPIDQGQYVFNDTVEDDAVFLQVVTAGASDYLTTERLPDPAPAGSSGGFSADDRALLQDLDSRLTGVTLTLTKPPVIDGGEFDLYQSYDYRNVDAQAVKFSVTGKPNLTGATVTMEKPGGELVVAGVVEAASATEPQIVRFEFDRTLTASVEQGRQPVRIRAILPEPNGDHIHLMNATMHVRQ